MDVPRHGLLAEMQASTTDVLSRTVHDFASHSPVRRRFCSDARGDACRVTDCAGGRDDADAGVRGHKNRDVAIWGRRGAEESHLPEHHHKLRGSDGHGLPQPEGLLVRPLITDVSETTIAFAGSSDPTATVSYSMNGTIDRVTGAVEAGFMSFPKEGYGQTWTSSYALKCRPAQRMF
jgi:hypothetical protein